MSEFKKKLEKAIELLHECENELTHPPHLFLLYNIEDKIKTAIKILCLEEEEK